MSDAEWSLHHSKAFDEDFERLRDKIYWSGLDGCSILLTGATGFFGLWLIELFDWLRRKNGVDIKLYVLTRNRGDHALEMFDVIYRGTRHAIMSHLSIAQGRNSV